jgi:hypothetical protein
MLLLQRGTSANMCDPSNAAICNVMLKPGYSLLPYGFYFTSVYAYSTEDRQLLIACCAGSCNNLCDILPDATESAARNAANIKWLKEGFEDAKRRNAGGWARKHVGVETRGWGGLRTETTGGDETRCLIAGWTVRQMPSNSGAQLGA